MRPAPVTVVVMEAYLLTFLILKVYLFLTAIPELPSSVALVVLNSASIYIYLKLLFRQLWAWYLILVLNLLGLALGVLYLISGSVLFQWGVALENGLMLVLLYLNRRIYINSFKSLSSTIWILRRASKLPYKYFYPSHSSRSVDMNSLFRNGSQPDTEEMSP